MVEEMCSLLLLVRDEEGDRVRGSLAAGGHWPARAPVGSPGDPTSAVRAALAAGLAGDAPRAPRLPIPMDVALSAAAAVNGGSAAATDRNSSPGEVALLCQEGLTEGTGEADDARPLYPIEGNLLSLRVFF